MFDVGWTELLLIGVVALIVIGPKDLPVMFHTLGRITARARGMAREFSSAMEDAAKASGVQEATRELRELQKLTSPRAMGLDALSRAADRFEKWDPLVPMRDAAGPVPDPSAPPPQGTALPGAAASNDTGAGRAAGGSVLPAVDGDHGGETVPGPAAPVHAAAVPTRVVPRGEPGTPATGLGLGLASGTGRDPADSDLSEAQSRPGVRRLHAMRRSERS
ncbi:Sec-independent protein translocase protein TatB [Paracoccus contaminans]|uniref:Twin arginine-targeting protein translocase TatB n=1 Tax=Paracoccus contaminans TaxID=1945662 RepID=A0A1W6CUW2_9RHOB|nr:Sec-independent protein translocase protein TatB [Paracoccus contaminans]ARJ68658.1 twin arginine-targeting protein translocase TatB [Paracoccus contaminans]